MFTPRPSAWALIAVLVASSAFAAASPSVTFAANPVGICPADQMPTRWTDQYHPPSTIRVLRAKGPNKGFVETVDFWKYVGHVLRAEFATGGSTPHPWMHIGALAVKQYAWYYTTVWRGGRVTVTNEDGSTQVQCYDVKDTTADQIYTDVKLDTSTNSWIPTNEPTAANLQAMRETWHYSLRKWKAKNSVTKMFLTGYRSGKQVPCGADALGFRVMQKSLRDCGVKKLTFEETKRKYYEPFYIVNARGNDVLADGSNWRGDLPMLVANGSSTTWRILRGENDGFSNGPTGSFAVDLANVLGYGVGNVHSGSGSSPGGAADGNLLADVILLVSTGGSGRQVRVAAATGNSLGSLSSFAAPNGAQQLLVADFDGDLLADAGLLSPVSAGQAKLHVMRATGNGGFGEAVEWWTGAFDVGQDVALAGDANGDGKADLVIREQSDGSFRVAGSFASCSDFSAWGVCPFTAVGPSGLGAATNWSTSASWAAGDTRLTVGDYDRDGRDDVIAVVKNGSGIKVFGLRSKPDGSFADPLQLWQGAIPFADLRVTAMNVNPDGLADIALLYPEGGNTKLTWLRTIERSTVPASMTSTSTLTVGVGGSNPTPTPSPTPTSSPSPTPTPASGPSVPQGLTGTAQSNGTVNLTWQASTSSVAGTIAYRVFRNGSAIGAKTPSLSYTDAPSASGDYRYQVRAIDAAGNKSALSPRITVSVTVPSGGDPVTTDTTPPSVPQNLTAQSLGQRRVSLSWSASTDDQPGTIEYRLFRNKKRIAVLTGTTHVDRPANVGTYNYKVRAVDAAGNRSNFSTTVKGSAT